MAEEKQFMIPLRKSFVKVPEYVKTKKAMNAIKKFIARHMKVEEVKIGQQLNLYMWKRGRKNPPPRVKVKSIKEEEDGKTIALVELPEAQFQKKKKEEKTKTKKKITEEKTKEPEAVKSQEEEKKKEEQLEQELVKEGKVREHEATKGKQMSKENKEKEQFDKMKKRATDETRSSHQ